MNSPFARSGPSYCEAVLILALAVAFPARVPPIHAATFDITNFGAVAGSDADARPALAGAIARAQAGDTVTLPAGNFQIRSEIRLKSGIRLAGAGRDRTTITFVGHSASPLVSLASTRDVELAGFTLDANHSPFATQGIAADGGRGHHLHDLRIKNLVKSSEYGPHGIYFLRTTDCRILNNDFQNMGVDSEWGAGIRLAHGSSRNEIAGNTIANSGRGGILANDSSTDLVIRDNIVAGSGRAPGGLGLGIELWNHCDRGLVENNQIDHWLSISSSSLAAVRNNVIGSTQGVKFCGLEMAAGGCHDILFVGNTVRGGAHLGISVSGDGVKQRALWAQNTITKSQTWGAQIQGDVGGARQLYFYANTFAGSIKGPANLYPGQGNGFRFNGNSTYINLDSNRFENNDNIGLELGGENVDQLTVVNNIIRGNAGPAVTHNHHDVGPFLGQDLVWSNNTVADNADDFQPAPVGFSNKPSPTVDIEKPESASTGDRVSFSFRAGSPSKPAHALWDFGDGLPETSFNPVHVYPKPGKYKVRLVVWDEQGRAAFDQTVLIVSPWS